MYYRVLKWRSPKLARYQVDEDQGLLMGFCGYINLDKL